MTATDELRRLLDERGVEYDDTFGGIEFYGEGGSIIIAVNSKSKDGMLYVHAFLTPEQAIEATLGSDLEAENAKLRELVRALVYATHPADRAELIADAAEMMAELGVDA